MKKLTIKKCLRLNTIKYLYFIIVCFLIFNPMANVIAQESDVLILDLRNIDGNPQPDSIVICGNQDTVSILIFPIQDTALTNAVMTVSLPAGLEYAGYVYGVETDGTPVAAVNELDVTSDPQNIRFNLPNLIDTMPFKFFLTLKANCELRDYLLAQNQVKISFKISYLDVQGINRTFTYEPFNEYNNAFKIPQVNILSVSPSYPVVIDGDIVKKTIIITQDGIDAFLKSLTYTNEYDSSAMRLDSIKVNGQLISFSDDGTTISINVDSSYFISGVFSEGDSITVTECWTTICSQTLSKDNLYTVWYGCDAMPCQSAQAIDGLTFTLASYSAAWSVMNVVQKLSMCDTGIIDFYVVNTASTPGKEDLYDITIGLDPKDIGGSTTNALYEQPPCWIYIGGNKFVVDTSGTFVTRSFFITDNNPQLTTDPDGPGGLSDLDGDGFYDDLAVGDTIFFRIKQYIVDNDDYGCVSFMVKGGLGTYSIRGTGRCGETYYKGYKAPFNTTFTSTDTRYNPNPATTVTIDIPTKTGVFSLGYYQSGYNSAFFDTCTGSQTELELILPSGITITDIEWEGASIAFVQNGDTVRAMAGTFFNDFSNKKTFDISFSIGPDCYNGEITYSLRVICGSCSYRGTSCNTVPVVIQCIATNPIRRNCAIRTVSLEVERTTFGWTDSTMSAIANNSTPGVRTDRGLPGDTVLFSVKTQVQKTGTDSLVLNLNWDYTWGPEDYTSFWPGPPWLRCECGANSDFYATVFSDPDVVAAHIKWREEILARPLFEYVSGSIDLRIYDFSAGSYLTVSCAVPDPIISADTIKDIEYGFNCFEEDYNFNLPYYSLDLTNCLPAGFTLEMGDSVLASFKTTIHDYAMNSMTDLNDYIPLGEVNPTVSFGANSPDSAFGYCDSISGNFHVSFAAYSEGRGGCNNSCDRVNEYKLSIDNSSVDFFPNEYRPVFRLDSVTMFYYIDGVIPEYNAEYFNIRNVGNIPYTAQRQTLVGNYIETRTVWINPGSWMMPDQGDAGVFVHVIDSMDYFCALGAINNSSSSYSGATFEYHMTSDYYKAAFNPALVGQFPTIGSEKIINTPNGPFVSGFNGYVCDPPPVINCTPAANLPAHTADPMRIVTFPTTTLLTNNLFTIDVEVRPEIPFSSFQYNPTPLDSILHWISIENFSQQVVVLQIEDLTSGGLEPLIELFVNPTKRMYLAELGNIHPADTKQYRITAKTNNCDWDSLNIQYGQHCQYYPIDPTYPPTYPDGSACILQFSPSFKPNASITLQKKYTFKPTNAGMQFEFLKQPETVDYCDTVEFVFALKNVGLADLDSLLFTLFTPFNGGTFLPNSFMAAYPDTTAYYAIPDFVATGNITNNGVEYQLGIDSINTFITNNRLPGVLNPDSNEVYIKFKMVISCAVSAGSVLNFIRLQAVGKALCVDPIVAPLTKSKKISITTPPTNDYIAVLDPPIIYGCAGTRELTVVVLNEGPGATVSSEEICVNIPYELPYIPGTVEGKVPIGWNPAARFDSLGTSQGFYEICVDMPVGVGVGKIMMFKTDIQISDTVSCGVLPAILQTKYINPVSCPPVPTCNADIITNIGEDQTIQVLPNLKIETISASSRLGGIAGACQDALLRNLETVTVQYTYCNKGEVLPAGTKVTVNIYQDINLNQDVDAIDYMIFTDTLTLSTALLKDQCISDSIVFELPDVFDPCNLLFEVVDDGNCACNAVSTVIGDIPLEGIFNTDVIKICASTTPYHYEDLTQYIICNNPSNITWVSRKVLSGPYQDAWGFFSTYPIARFYSPAGTSWPIGSFEAVYEYERYNGCNIYDTLIFELNPALESVVASVSNNTIVCKEDSCVMLQAIITDPSGDTISNLSVLDSLQFIWTPNQYLDDNTLQNPMACISDDIQYTITVMGACDTLTDSVNLTYISCGIIIVDTTEFCWRPDSIYSITADILSLDTSYNYYIILDGDTLQTVMNENNTRIVFNLQLPSWGNYALEIFAWNSFAATAYSQIVTLSVLDPNVDLIINTPPLEFCKNESYQLETNLDPTHTFVWTPNDNIDDTTAPQPMIITNDSIIYTLVATNQCGFSDTDDIAINVIACDFFIPNAFSPNGDGKNDLFLIRGDGIQAIFIRIYDRWGNKVFETSEINIGWDGKHKGKQLANGVYVYQMIGSFLNKDEFEQKGNITLVR